MGFSKSGPQQRSCGGGGGGGISLVVPVQEEKREGEHQEDEEDHHPKSIIPTSSITSYKSFVANRYSVYFTELAFLKSFGMPRFAKNIVFLPEIFASFLTFLHTRNSKASVLIAKKENAKK
jgi:hypothetical protein